MPKLGRGLYPLMGCVQWYIRYWENKALGREGNVARTEKQTLENEILRAKVREATGHLIDRAEVVMVVSSAFMRLGKYLDSLPSIIQRECPISTDSVRVIRVLLDEGRRNFVRDSAEFIEVVEEKRGDTKKKRA